MKGISPIRVYKMGLFNRGKNSSSHYTCTGNSKYGSGDGSENATITDADLEAYFGYVPSDPTARYIMGEQLLAHDRPQPRAPQRRGR